MECTESGQRTIYQIEIKENLDPGTTDRFGGLMVTLLETGGTRFVGPFPDQSALRGFLDQLWNLNFTVLSVDCRRR